VKRRRAVALTYDSSLPAPIVVAKGAQHLAARLLEIARERGVPIVEDSVLAESLFLIETGRFIPEPFYRAVAEILAFVWRTTAQDKRAEAVDDKKKGQK
jgi:flagellar biosynthetic protein FlhB